MAENITGIYKTTTLANSGVVFKQGSLANLNTLLSNGGATEGTFYLTNDTHRLYVGRTKASDNKVYPVPVNEGILTVANLTALNALTANVGDFCYITDDNILAVCASVTPVAGESGTRTCHWVQINANTNTTNNDADFNLSKIGSTDNVKIEYVVKDSASNEVKDNFTLIPGSNITATVGGSAGAYTLTITADDTTYTLGTNTSTGSVGSASKGVLKINDGTSDQTVNIKGSGSANGNGLITVSSDNAGNITITPSVIGSLTGSNHSTANNGTGFDFTLLVDGVDKKGSIDPLIDYGTGTGDSAGSATEHIKFSNGIATLDVMTRAQTKTAIEDAITDNLRTFDALHYKGAVVPDADSGTHLPLITAAENGDVYKVSKALTSTNNTGGVIAKAGDLVIAKGTESDSTGLITSGTWEVISAGDEPEPTAKTNITNGFEIDKSVGGAETKVLKFQVNANDGLEMGTDTSTTTDKTVVIKHSDVTRTDDEYAYTKVPSTATYNSGTTYYTLNTTTHQFEAASISAFANGVTYYTRAADLTLVAKGSLTFYALDGEDAATAILTDARGHVTGVNGHKVTVTDTHANVDAFYNYPDSAVAQSLTAKITAKVGDSDGSTATTAVNLLSDTLYYTTTVSGSGASRESNIKVDMLWGSFDT